MSLTLNNIRLAQGPVPHLDGISANFRRGELTTVIGRTLAGKTTLMRVLAGLQGADSGQIRLDGNEITQQPAWRRDVAMVYQQFINYPHLTVFENVAFPLRKRRVADAEVRARVKQNLERVGLGQMADRQPAALSGGQQQRVALARALVRQAPILLLDEPLVNLDYKLREQLRDDFRGLLVSQSEAIVLYNTTDPAEAMMLGDQVVVLHEGRVLQSGRPTEIFESPASAIVAGIVNDPPMNLIDGEIGAEGVRLKGGTLLHRPRHFNGLASGPYRFGIRANEMMIDVAGIAGKLTFSEVSGSETFCYFDAPFGSAVVQIEGVHRLALGNTISISINPDRLFCFGCKDDGPLISAPNAIARGLTP